MTEFYVVREMTARFGDDFETALNEPSLPPIALEIFKRNAIQYAADVFNGLDNVG